MNFYKLSESIDKYGLSCPDESKTVHRFRQLLSKYESCYESDCWAGHITSSAWILDPSRLRVLLTLHRKLGIWCQLGGHSDGDRNTPFVALREAYEESGLRLTLIDYDIFDLDIHNIAANGEEPKHLHFDVRFLIQSESTDFVISDESLELAWVSVNEIEKFSREESLLRMKRKWLKKIF